MKLLLDIKDENAIFFMELLKNFPFVKVKPITGTKAEFLTRFRDSIEQVKLAKENKIKLRSAEDLINEL